MNYEAWQRLLAEESLPAAVIDLDAVRHNVAVLVAARRRDLPLRLASKSLRVPALMRWLLAQAPNVVRGIMPYAASEAAYLVAQGFDDLLMGYPVGTPHDARILAQLVADGHTVIATVDEVAQVDLLAAAARAAGTTMPLCLDVDVSWRPLGGRVHLGVRRSPVRDVAGALAVALHIQQSPGVRLTAVLAYEAQVAGLADRSPDAPGQGPARRWIKARSVPLAAQRRAAIVDALRAAGHEITVVNGGGTGSVGTTSQDPSVTEVTVGSGFLCPHLFDGYDGLPLQPAAFFALPVVRHSDPGYVTCFGGGWIASGSTGPDRSPRVHLPAGLTPVGLEGWGEVQTPFRLSSAAPPLPLGAPVIARHAKAGELFERFSHVLLVENGAIVDRALTYRGGGGWFGT